MTKLELFSATVCLLHESAADRAQWPNALRAVLNLIAADKGALFDYRPDSKELFGVLQIGHDPEMLNEYLAHYYAVDPTMRFIHEWQSDDPAVLFENFSATERSRHEYFAEFAPRADIGDVSAVFSDPVGVPRTLLSLQRPFAAAGFDRDSKRLIKAIQPHLRIAKRVEALLASAAERTALVSASLDRFVAAAFIVDQSGRIRHLNAAASRLLNTHRRFVSKGGVLRLSGAESDHFNAAIRGATGPAGHSSILGLSSREGEVEEIAVSPLMPSHELAMPWQLPLALVVVSGPPRNADAIVRRAQVLFGATAAEARVMTALALGQSVEEIALAHEVKVSTVRSQIKSLLGKTGTTRQADLVRLALAGAPLTP